jgi:hypothetical protein
MDFTYFHANPNLKHREIKLLWMSHGVRLPAMTQQLLRAGGGAILTPLSR